MESYGTVKKPKGVVRFINNMVVYGEIREKPKKKKEKENGKSVATQNN
jgi:hypothetical protein